MLTLRQVIEQIENHKIVASADPNKPYSLVPHGTLYDWQKTLEDLADRIMKL